jgi:hypothetical protein
MPTAMVAVVVVGIVARRVVVVESAQDAVVVGVVARSVVATTAAGGQPVLVGVVARPVVPAMAVRVQDVRNSGRDPEARRGITPLQPLDPKDRWCLNAVERRTS